MGHYLQKLGVGPEVLVGVCVERSIEMIVGLLGILKASGAYVPLDPEYPKDRVAFMMEDAKAPILLTQVKALDLPPESKTQLVFSDKDWDVIATESKKNVKSGVKSDNLVYVIYTSGSTGKPKGVMVRHYNVVKFVRLALMFPYGKFFPAFVMEARYIMCLLKF